jgi:hypothetical protein
MSRTSRDGIKPWYAITFIKRYQIKGEGSCEADIWGALDGRIPPVYSRYRPRIPWIKAATMSAFFSIAV